MQPPADLSWIFSTNTQILYSSIFKSYPVRGVLFSLANACLCLQCVMGRQRRGVEEEKSGVQKEEVYVCAEGETEATFLRLLTEILLTSIISTCWYTDTKQTPHAGMMSVDMTPLWNCFPPKNTECTKVYWEWQTRFINCHFKSCSWYYVCMIVEIWSCEMVLESSHECIS